MDKNEYRVRLDQINDLVDRQDYKKALDIVDTIDWRRVRSARTLCMVAEIYEANQRYEDSRRLLMMAHHRAPIGKTVLYRLVELAVKMGNFAEANDYYDQFTEISPNDNSRYILKYKIYRGQKAPIQDQIAILEEYKSKEYTERWSYELARLYAKAGMKDKCVETCDDIVLWFSEGKYVTRAMELKMKFEPLSPSQKMKYENRDKGFPQASTMAATAASITAATQAASRMVSKQEEIPEKEEKPEQETEKKTEESSIFSPIREPAGALQEKIVKGIKDVFAGGVAVLDRLAEDEEEVEEDEETAEEDTQDYVVKDLEPDTISSENSIKPAAMKEAVKEEKTSKKIKERKETFTEKIPLQTTPVEEEKKEEPVKEFNLDALFAETAGELAQAVAQVSEGVLDANPAPIKKAENYIMPVQEEKPVEEAVEKPVEEAVEEPVEEPVEEIAEEDLTEETQEILLEEEDDDQDIIYPNMEAILTEAAVSALQEREAESESESEDDMIVYKKVEDMEELPEEFSEEVIEEPAEEVVEEAVEEPAEEVVEEAVEEPAEEIVEEAVEEPAEEVAEEAVEEPAEEVVEEAVEEPAEEVAEEPAEQPETEQEVTEAATIQIPVEEVKEQCGRPAIDLSKVEEAVDLLHRHNLTSEEHRRLFTYFAPVPGLSQQIREALDCVQESACDRTSRSGNVIITGRGGTGKTRLCEGVIKAICKERHMEGAKIAYIEAIRLNRKDPASVVNKLSGGFLVIENASGLDPVVIEKLSKAMEFKTDRLTVILEDLKTGIRKMEAAYPEFMKKFDARIVIPVFTNDELVSFAKTYSKEMGYKIDDMAVLALYTLIGDNQDEQDPVSVGQVKDMMDSAIRHASKGGRRPGKKVAKRHLDESGRIMLYEKDFDA